MSDDYEISSNGEEFTYSYWVKQYEELQQKHDAYRKLQEVLIHVDAIHTKQINIAIDALSEIRSWYDGHNNLIANRALIEIDKLNTVNNGDGNDKIEPKCE